LSKSKSIVYSDQELIRLFRESEDSKYLGMMYQRYAMNMFGVCMKYIKNVDDSQDAVMEIFEKLHHDIKRHDIANFKSWILTVTRNHCLMILRKNGLQVEYKDEIEFEYGNSISDFDARNEAEAKEKKLNKMDICVQKLNDIQRLCIDMFYLQGFSYKEIEVKTQLSYKEVKTHIQNGKLNLKKCIESNV